MDLPDKVRGRVLQRIHGRFDVEGEINSDLFTHTWDALNGAVDKSFGQVVFGEDNYDFIQALKYNNAVFAAFKTHRQQNDLAGLLTDGKGKLRGFNDFRKAAGPVLDSYNNKWLKTEYDTAVKSARTAALFLRFEKDKDLFPNLKWVPSRAVTPRDTHKPYYNSIRRIGDSWLRTHYPGCLYGCQCDITNTREGITHVGSMPVSGGVPEKEAGETVVPGLDRNPAYTGSIFTDNHPYVKQAYPGAAEAVSKKCNRVDNSMKWAREIKDAELNGMATNAAIKLEDAGFGLPRLESKNLGGMTKNGIVPGQYGNGIIYINNNKDLSKGNIKKHWEGLKQSGWSATDNPILHESARYIYQFLDPKGYGKAHTATPPLKKDIIKKYVSGYAATKHVEFEAELISGILDGRTFPLEIMNASFLRFCKDERGQRLYGSGLNKS